MSVYISVTVTIIISVIVKGNPTLRLTKQRQTIIEELRGVTSHPTAFEIFEMVRARLPKISLGTVYRNLEILSESGIIQKLDTPGSRKRYDGVVENHYHVRCSMCGRVDDLRTNGALVSEESVQRLTDYVIINHTLEFIGICPDCNGEGGHSTD